MNRPASLSAATTAKIVLAAAAFAAATGLAFALWLDKGAAIFMTMIESGLAWCL